LNLFMSADTKILQGSQVQTTCREQAAGFRLTSLTYNPSP